jgi:zeta-carotene desaturase
MKQIVVVGGGVAGLAAALRLRKHSARITVLEASPKFGGRSYSFQPRGGGSEIDNGQHVLMGCCRDTLEYLRICGTAELLDRRRGMALSFVHADGRRALLAAGGLPHPIGLAQAFLSYRMLPLASRLGITRVAWRLKTLSAQERDTLDAIGAEEWLRSLRQRDDAIACFWKPVILATMNTAMQHASAKLLSVVLTEIFLGKEDASDMLLPRTGLTPLLVDGALEKLRQHETRLRSHVLVERLDVAETGVRGVWLKDGDYVPTDIVVSAIPPWSLQRLVENSGIDGTGIEFSRFVPSEILSLHFWSRRDLGLPPMTGLLETALHWIFAKGQDADGSYRYSATISAVPESVPRDDDALRTILLRELRLAMPDLTEEDILRLQAIREKRATFLPRPGLEPFRPHTRSAVPGLYLAGDWTATGLPATIESAVRSGFAAGDAVIADAERVAKVDTMESPLPTEPPRARA